MATSTQPGSGGGPEAPPQSREQIQILSGNWDPKMPLDYTIHGRPAFTYVDFNLKGNKVLADGESMLWMDSQLQLETECYGGCWASCIRQCAGEACCMNNYQGIGKVTLGFEQPGDMLAFGVTRGHPWALTRQAFIGGTTNLKVGAKFSGCCVCCCTDEGPFLTTVDIMDDAEEDSGIFMAGSYGMLEKHEVPAGKKMYVAKGNFFAGHSEQELSVTMIGGCANFCCGASWRSIVLQFDGPCTIYTQSRNPMDLLRLQTAARQAQAQQGQEGGGDGGGDVDIGGE